MDFCWAWDAACKLEGIAAWVQAFASFGAIIWAVISTKKQSKDQYDNTLLYLETQHKNALAQIKYAEIKKEVARLDALIARGVVIMGLIEHSIKDCTLHKKLPGDYNAREQEYLMEEIKRAERDMDMLSIFDFSNADTIANITFIRSNIIQIIQNWSGSVQNGKTISNVEFSRFEDSMINAKASISESLETIKSYKDSLQQNLN